MKLLVLFFFVLGSACLAELRTWTAVNGKKVEAEYVSLSKEIVKLRLKSGNLFEVSRNKLTKEDNAFIDSIYTEKTPLSLPQSKKWVKPSNAINLNTLNEKVYRSLSTLFPSDYLQSTGVIKKLETGFDLSNSIYVDEKMEPYTGKVYSIWTVNNEEVKFNNFALEGYLKKGKAHGDFKLFVTTKTKKTWGLFKFNNGDPLEIIYYWPNQLVMLWQKFKPLNKNVVLEYGRAELFYPNGDTAEKLIWNPIKMEYEIFRYLGGRGEKGDNVHETLDFSDERFMTLFRENRWRSIFYKSEF